MAQEYHSFKVELATMRLENGNAVGVENAIFLQDIAYWCDYNRSSNANFKDGRYWMFSTVNGFEKRHPYWTKKQLRRIISSCENAGLLISGSYNKDKRDRTKWYTVSDIVLVVLGMFCNDRTEAEGQEMGNAESHMGRLDFPYGHNTTAHMGKCIYNEENTERKIQQENAEDPAASTDVPARCTARQMQPVIDAWNALGLQQIKLGDSTTTRYKQLKARINSYGLDGVMSAIEKVKTSVFLKGDNTRGWVISFDWFIKPNNFPKVIEGNYNNQHPRENTQQARKKSWSDIAREMESEGWTI